MSTDRHIASLLAEKTSTNCKLTLLRLHAVNLYFFVFFSSCYHSVQNLWSFSSLYKNLKMKIYRTIILPVVLYRREIWSLTLREERRLRLFGN
jgi:hypothetical protein